MIVCNEFDHSQHSGATTRFRLQLAHAQTFSENESTAHAYDSISLQNPRVISLLCHVKDCPRGNTRGISERIA